MAGWQLCAPRPSRTSSIAWLAGPSTGLLPSRTPRPCGLASALHCIISRVTCCRRWNGYGCQVSSALFASIPASSQSYGSYPSSVILDGYSNVYHWAYVSNTTTTNAYVCRKVACAPNADLLGGPGPSFCSTAAPSVQSSTANLGWIAAVVIGVLLLALVALLVYLYKYRNGTYNALVAKVRPAKRDSDAAPMSEVVTATPQLRSFKQHRKSSTIQMLQSSDDRAVLDTLGPRDNEPAAPEAESDVQLDMILTRGASQKSPPGNRLPSLKKPVDPFDAPVDATPHTPAAVSTPPSSSPAIARPQPPVALPQQQRVAGEPRRKISLASRKVAPISEEDLPAQGNNPAIVVNPPPRVHMPRGIVSISEEPELEMEEKRQTQFEPSADDKRQT